MKNNIVIIRVKTDDGYIVRKQVKVKIRAIGRGTRITDKGLQALKEFRSQPDYTPPTY